MQSLAFIDRVLAHSQDGVFASPPDTLQVDLHSQIPDTLLGVERIVVIGMHNAGIVELQSKKHMRYT